MATIFDRVVGFKKKSGVSDQPAPQPAAVKATTKNGVLVYMNVSVGKRNVGRMIFELFYDETPKTAENFRVLCTGERGLSPVSGKPLHFKGSTFHRIIRGFMAQGGDFTNGDGTGGESIYGSKFPDEDFTRKHEVAGLLSMANAGANTNGSQFFITFQATPHLDNKHVVFGKIVEGKHVLSALEVVATGARDKPRMPVTITECGQLGEQDQQEEDEGQKKKQEQPQVKPKHRKANAGMSQAEMSMAIVSGLKSFAGRGRKARRQKKRPQEEDEEEQPPPKPRDSVVVAESAPTSAEPAKEAEVPVVQKLTPREQKLHDLREKIRLARYKNKEATKIEYAKVSDPNFEKKRKRTEWLEYKERKHRDMEKRGRTATDAYLDQSAIQLGRVYHKRAIKEENRAAFGWNVFNQDTIHKANTKRLNSLPQRGAEGNVVEDTYIGAGVQTSKSALRELAKDIGAQQEKRKKFSRRRRHNPDADVDYINDRNAHFNKKIGRAFDKYTVEIKQNLERGTAL